MSFDPDPTQSTPTPITPGQPATTGQAAAPGPIAPGHPQTFTPTPPEAGASWPTQPVTQVAGAAPAAPIPVAAPAARRSSTGRLLNIVLVVAAAVAIGGVAFAAGRTTAPAAATTTGRFGAGAGAGNGNFPNASGRPAFGGANGQGGPGRFGAGLAISGTVESVTGDTLTIKTDDGRTIQFTLGASTTYATQTPATAADVTTGSKVQVSLDLSNGIGRGGFNNPQASAGPVGTAGSVTVVP